MFVNWRKYRDNCRKIDNDYQIFFGLFFFFNFAGVLYRKQTSKNDKIIERFKSLPKDFTFDEVEKLLSLFGYEKLNKGKISGSRVMFKKGINPPILLHKPHPGNIIKQYALKDRLENEGLI